ncbi:hypothetical protein BDZ89DRAFT_1183752, partial [Hymenopellis radicata]
MPHSHQLMHAGSPRAIAQGPPTGMKMCRGTREVSQADAAGCGDATGSADARFQSDPTRFQRVTRTRTAGPASLRLSNARSDSEVGVSAAGASNFAARPGQECLVFKCAPGCTRHSHPGVECLAVPGSVFGRVGTRVRVFGFGRRVPVPKHPCKHSVKRGLVPHKQGIYTDFFQIRRLGPSAEATRKHVIGWFLLSPTTTTSDVSSLDFESAMKTPALDSESAPYKWRTTLRRLHGNTASWTQSASTYYKEETPPATLNSVLEERGRRIWGATSSAGDVVDWSLLHGWRMRVYTGTPVTLHGWRRTRVCATPANGCGTRVRHSGATRVRVSGSEPRMTRPTSASAPVYLPRSPSPVSSTTTWNYLQRLPSLRPSTVPIRTSRPPPYICTRTCVFEWETGSTVLGRDRMPGESCCLCEICRPKLFEGSGARSFTVFISPRHWLKERECGHYADFTQRRMKLKFNSNMKIVNTTVSLKSLLASNRHRDAVASDPITLSDGTGTLSISTSSAKLPIRCSARLWSSEDRPLRPGEPLFSPPSTPPPARKCWPQLDDSGSEEEADDSDDIASTAKAESVPVFKEKPEREIPLWSTSYMAELPRTINRASGVVLYILKIIDSSPSITFQCFYLMDYNLSSGKEVLVGSPPELDWEMLASQACTDMQAAKERLGGNDSSTSRRGPYFTCGIGITGGNGWTVPHNFAMDYGEETILRDLLNTRGFEVMGDIPVMLLFIQGPISLYGQAGAAALVAAPKNFLFGPYPGLNFGRYALCILSFLADALHEFYPDTYKEYDETLETVLKDNPSLR